MIRSGWYLLGEENRCFEEEYSRYIGVSHTVGCANGLDALTLILRAYKELGVMSDGDEVIVPANTYIATILSITENSLVPVLVEPDKDTLQIDIAGIESCITPLTKAIMSVHLYGRCSHTSELDELRRRYNLKLIEDNAQAHGCMFKGQRTGSLGDAAAHSFLSREEFGCVGRWRLSLPPMLSLPEWCVVLRTMALTENMYLMQPGATRDLMRYRQLC